MCGRNDVIKPQASVACPLKRVVRLSVPFFNAALLVFSNCGKSPVIQMGSTTTYPFESIINNQEKE